MRIFKHSEKGGDHAENEDFVIAQNHPSFGNRWLIAIADGQGGRVDGAKASKSCCEHAIETLSNYSWQDLNTPSLWDHLIESMDGEVRAACEGFTTAIVFAVCPEFISGTSVGDSKLYYRNEITELIELTSRQRKNPPIGAGCKFGTYFEVKDPIGQFVAMTDGVWKYAGYLNIGQALNSPIEESVNITRPHCQLRSGQLQDDFTIVAVSI